MANPLIEQKLSLLPEFPGCYMMKDAAGEIIYVGKAKSLKNRVRSYFRGAHDTKTTLLVSDIHDFEFIVTRTNKESLLLEISLIKKYQPKYNIRLKHGTMYPYLKVTNERHPQLIITSNVSDDGGEYFGPYPDVSAASQTLQLLQKSYPLRRCGLHEKRACFYYHLGQCIGCCDHEVPVSAYVEQIKRIKRFLNGDVADIKRELKLKMQRAADELAFEQASDYRDQIHYIETTVERQYILSKDYSNHDLFAYSIDRGWVSIQVFLLRQSSIMKREATSFPYYGDPEEAVLTYIMQFYQLQHHPLPKEIIVPGTLDTQLLSDTLECPVHVPQRGKKRSLLDVAQKNCEIALNEQFRLEEMKARRTVSAAQELATALGLPTAKTIEAFDHSNIQGAHPVSAMVCYVDGIPQRSAYRKYHVKTVVGSNEFATTQEVIRRRFTRLLKEHKPLPDLILMDGGKVQVHAAQEVLEDELGLNIPIAGMVKDDKHKTATLIFGPELLEVPLDQTSAAFHLVQRIQEEVHRFAISFHRQIRSKNTFASTLESIPGVGPKTRRLLLKATRHMKELAQLSEDELVNLGVKRNTAQQIVAHFQAAETTH